MGERPISGDADGKLGDEISRWISVPGRHRPMASRPSLSHLASTMPDTTTSLSDNDGAAIAMKPIEPHGLCHGI